MAGFHRINSTRTKRGGVFTPGFTLVELLVVITIIGMLAALTLVAVQGARARALQVRCLNNMNNLGKGFQTYHTSKNCFPGYAEKLLGKEISWAVAIFNEVGEGNRLTDILKFEKLTPDKQNNIFTELPLYRCPADSLKGNSPPPLSYAVNCGTWIPTDINGDGKVYPRAEFGVFGDRRLSGTKKMTLDTIQDGTSSTLLVVENVHATTWAVRDNGLKYPAFPKDASDASLQDDGSGIGQVGFLWSFKNATAALLPNFADNVANVRPNFNKTDSYEEANLANHAAVMVWLRNHARPSSNHNGVFNATFADGRSEGLNTEMDLDVYTKMCCPDESRAEKYFDGTCVYP